MVHAALVQRNVAHGPALFEDTVYDPCSGGMVNADLSEYLVATNPDALEFDISFVNEPDFYSTRWACAELASCHYRRVRGGCQCSLPRDR